VVFPQHLGDMVTKFAAHGLDHHGEGSCRAAGPHEAAKERIQVRRWYSPMRTSAKRWGDHMQQPSIYGDRQKDRQTASQAGRQTAKFIDREIETERQRDREIET